MKKAKVKLDLEHDSAEEFGKRVLLSYTLSGHYCVPIARLKSNEVDLFIKRCSCVG